MKVGSSAAAVQPSHVLSLIGLSQRKLRLWLAWIGMVAFGVAYLGPMAVAFARPVSVAAAPLPAIELPQVKLPSLTVPKLHAPPVVPAVSPYVGPAARPAPAAAAAALPFPVTGREPGERPLLRRVVSPAQPESVTRTIPAVASSYSVAEPEAAPTTPTAPNTPTPAASSAAVAADPFASVPVVTDVVGTAAPIVEPQADDGAVIDTVGAAPALAPVDDPVADEFVVDAVGAPPAQLPTAVEPATPAAPVAAATPAPPVADTVPDAAVPADPGVAVVSGDDAAVPQFISGTPPAGDLVPNAEFVPDLATEAAPAAAPTPAVVSAVDEPAASTPADVYAVEEPVVVEPALVEPVVQAPAAVAAPVVPDTFEAEVSASLANAVETLPAPVDLSAAVETAAPVAATAEPEIIGIASTDLAASPPAALPTWAVALPGTGGHTFSLTLNGGFLFLTIDGVVNTRPLLDVPWVTLTGGDGDDTLDLNSTVIDVVPIVFDAGKGNDTIRGPPADTVWSITDPGAGTVGKLAFSNVEWLRGAPNNEDTFVIQANGVLAGGVDGGDGGFDSLVVDGKRNSIVSTPTDPHSGTLVIDGTRLYYAGLEPITLGAGAVVTITGTAGDDAITVAPGGGGNIVVSGGTFETTFIAPPASLTITGGGGYDTVTFTGAISLGAASLSVNAERIDVAAGASITTTGDVTLVASASRTCQPDL